MGKILTAREGYVYSNGETFDIIIRLGKNDSAENWHEITDEEAQALRETEITD